jgi:hypothetical protein
MHDPRAHDCVAAHVEHAAPPAPQAGPVSPVVHVAPAQQPLAHDVASQTHAPETQC